MIYHFAEAQHHEWNDDFKADEKDSQLVAKSLRSSKLYSHDLERFDMLNIYHVNLLRCILENKEATIDKLVSIRF